MSKRRTRATTALVAAAITVAVVTGGALASQAASGVKITEATDSNFPDMAFVLSLPQKQPLTAADLRVTENGNPVNDVTVGKPGANDVGVVLLIDASNSMAGQPIVGAMAAARAFAARRDPSQKLALITFNSESTVALPLTSATAAINTALSSRPKLANGTHIYDALESAVSLLKDSGVTSGSIVLLSDGTDVGSSTDQSTAIQSVKDARIRVFAIGLPSGQYSPESLRAIGEQTSGTYTEATGTQALEQIYGDLGYTLSNEYVARYRSLTGPDKNIRVAIQVKGIPGTARVTYTTPALPAAAATKGLSTWDKIIRSPITLFLVILAIVALLGLAVFRILYRPHDALMQRIGNFVTLPKDEEARQRKEAVAMALASPEQRQSHDRWQGFVESVELARISLPPRTILLLTAVAGLAIGVFVSIIVGSPVAVFVGLIAFPIANALIKRRLRYVQRQFSDQLPENLDLISSGLRAGHSFIAALAVCVEDAVEPSKSEFQRVITDEQLGVAIDESLHVVAIRMDSRDVVQIALVARLQRDAGTNAADVIEQVANNVRSRLELRRLIATLTAQGRMARWIVSLLPVMLFVAIYFLNPDYLSPLWQDPVGIVGLIAAGIMIVLGSLVIKRIVEIEV